MTWLELWTQTPLAKALAWTLLHTLWEGAAAALLLAAALYALHSPRARYAAACMALLALLVGFTTTLARLWPAKPRPLRRMLRLCPGRRKSIWRLPMRPRRTPSTRPIFCRGLRRSGCWEC